VLSVAALNQAGNDPTAIVKAAATFERKKIVKNRPYKRKVELVE
jgi:hypothetical protein